MSRARARRPAALWLAVALVMAAAFPCPVAGQDDIPRIGVLVARPKAALPLPALVRGLDDVGYVHGRTARIEYRYAEGRTDLLAGLAADLVRLNVDVIVALDTPAVRAAKDATATIPIIMSAGEPVATGLIASLARPGGNVTGITGASAQISGKTLALFRELLPRATRLGLLLHRTDPFAGPLREHTEAAAAKLGLEVHALIMEGAKDLDAAFAAATRARVDGLYVQGILATRQLAALATRHRLPAMSHSGQFARVGGLMGYGGDFAATYRRLGLYVDKVLKGARPADLPVEQPTTFRFAINLKTARAIGVTIPQSLLLQADQLID